MIEPNDGEYFIQSVESFAQRVGVSAETVRTWIKDNRIPTIKMGKRRLIDIRKLKAKLDNDD
ncbi:excisionase family DNA-binding protein [Endozoicomonas elysicola]|uniref:Helix-turn-helix domain-containing protein n=1 Tax=Endozoicomonas elysicola TaxID=305900 RepID=A0A081KB76_9GAMM|nr:excisionase family DNA-binding protein [Endozoicomonas elysicola]KEI71402.1 hypothetical protein GV64_12205 [Endozoicomonas elysicola]